MCEGRTAWDLRSRDFLSLWPLHGQFSGASHNFSKMSTPQLDGKLLHLIFYKLSLRNLFDSVRRTDYSRIPRQPCGSHSGRINSGKYFKRSWVCCIIYFDNFRVAIKSVDIFFSVNLSIFSKKKKFLMSWWMEDVLLNVLIDFDKSNLSD